MGTPHSIRANDDGTIELLARASEDRATHPRPLILVSGGFDPIHSGHLALINGASRFGVVWVALNSDEWLFKKKGYFVLPWSERAAIIANLRNVARVLTVDDSDGTVAKAILEVQPDIFANGGDRYTSNPSEAHACKSVGARELFDIGGTHKLNSSSRIIDKLWRSLHK